MKSEIAITPRMPRVVAAFFPLGVRKAPTPFEIASTPVRATAPEANARTSRKTPIAPDPTVTGWGTVACGQLPATHFPTPTATSTNIAATKEYVGRANAIPDSRTPRRLTSVRTPTAARERATLCESTDGASDVIARMPAATDTATVR